MITLQGTNSQGNTQRNPILKETQLFMPPIYKGTNIVVIFLCKQINKKSQETLIVIHTSVIPL